MKLLRRILHLEDEAAKTKALETEREIREVRAGYENKLEEIQARINEQGIHNMIKRNDPLFSQWGGAMDILRGRE